MFSLLRKLFRVMSDSALSCSALLPGTPWESSSAQFQTPTTSPCMHWDSRHLLQPWRLLHCSLFSSLSFCAGYSSQDYPLEMQVGGGGGFLCPENESCGLTPHFWSLPPPSATPSATPTFCHPLWRSQVPLILTSSQCFLCSGC